MLRLTLSMYSRFKVMRLSDREWQQVSTTVKTERGRRSLMAGLSPQASGAIEDLKAWTNDISPSAILEKVKSGAVELHDGWERRRSMRVSSRQRIAVCQLQSDACLVNWAQEVVSKCFNFSWQQRLGLFFANNCLVYHYRDIELAELQNLFKDLEEDHLHPELIIRIRENYDHSSSVHLELYITVTDSLVKLIISLFSPN